MTVSRFCSATTYGPAATFPRLPPKFARRFESVAARRGPSINCPSISYIGYGDDNVRANAVGIIFFVVVANLLAEIAYVATGALLGVSAGSFIQVLITLFGMSIWALLISPIVLPVFTRLHVLVFDSRSTL